MCSRDLNPVCGCDFQEYVNECLANNAGVNVMSYGECPEFDFNENRDTRMRSVQWLSYHNEARKEWHEKEGYTFVPLEWSLSLKSIAEDFAKERAAECVMKAPAGSELNQYGWNVAAKMNDPGFRSVEDVFTLWENKLYSGWPGGFEITTNVGSALR